MAKSVKQAGTEWVSALSQCQQRERLLETGRVGEAVSLPGSAIRIPAGSLRFVQATCNQGPALSTVLLEPLSYGEGNLPTNLLISSALLSVSRGAVNVPVVNVGEEDQWLKPRTVLGTLHLADVHSSSQTVQAEEQTQEEGRRVVFIRSMVAESPPPSTISGLDELKWPDLSPHEITTAKTLLSKYSDTFSLYEGDVGCTNLIHHEIPLVDDVPDANALPGIAVPTTSGGPPPTAPQRKPEFTAHTMAVDAAPVRTQADLQALQAADPAIKAFLPY
ncbi:hypothetical protein AAFF_G00057950 [Aldrovandia affinis]|uniref:Uncharacterized protein n=1 Tax=Aldrovandia affinis TaxID=143900 RepID=A0AAD7S0Y4_9TELE|nr:hypothetical protein AAFF_G00057950 [Aldrovandia affinis]